MCGTSSLCAAFPISMSTYLVFSTAAADSSCSSFTTIIWFYWGPFNSHSSFVFVFLQQELLKCAFYLS